MEQQIFVGDIERIILKVNTYLIIAFFLLTLINLIGGRPIRIFIYKMGSLLIFSIFRNSFSLFVASLVALMILIVSEIIVIIFSNIGSKLILIALSVLIILFIVFIVVGVVNFIKWGGPSSASKLKKVINRQGSNIPGLLLRLIIFIVIIFMIYLIFEPSTPLIKIISGFLQYFYLFLSVIIVPAFVFNGYRMMKNFWRFIAYGKIPKLNQALVHLKRYCFIVGGQNYPGQFSDMLNFSFSLYNKKRTLKSAEATDVFDRIKIYTDYNDDIDVWESTEKTDIANPINSGSVQDSIEIGVIRLFGRFAENITIPFKLFLIDSIDYNLLKNEWKNEKSIIQEFTNRLSSIYLFVGSKTNKYDIDLFINLLQSSNILRGFVFVVEQEAMNAFENNLINIRGIDIFDLNNNKPRYIIERILSNERAALKNRLGNSNAVTELVHLEIAKSKIEKIIEENENGYVDENCTIQNLKEIKNKHEAEIEARNGSFLDFENADKYFEVIPDSIKFLNFIPAKDLIRLMFRESDYSTRVYILFNLIEMITKTFVFAILSSRSSEHGDVKNFPDGLTSISYGRIRVTDFADDVNYLKRFIIESEFDKENLHVLHSQLFSQLTKKIDISISEHLEQLRIFYPYIYDIRINNVIELLDFSSFLRNQIRGHGVVTNFVATIVYPIFLNIFDIICRTIEELQLNLKINDNNSVDIKIGEVSVPAGKFIMYNTELNDFIFLEGYRNSQSIYISFTGGKKYKPTVLTGLNNS